jgi:hypothetical protein
MDASRRLISRGDPSGYRALDDQGVRTPASVVPAAFSLAAARDAAGGSAAGGSIRLRNAAAPAACTSLPALLRHSTTRSTRPASRDGVRTLVPWRIAHHACEQRARTRGRECLSSFEIRLHFDEVQHQLLAHRSAWATRCLPIGDCNSSGAGIRSKHVAMVVDPYRGRALFVIIRP